VLLAIFFRMAKTVSCHLIGLPPLSFNLTRKAFLGFFLWPLLGRGSRCESHAIPILIRGFFPEPRRAATLGSSPKGRVVDDIWICGVSGEVPPLARPRNSLLR
jgi:hypothetical protein